MKTSNKISLAALALSVASILVIGTYYATQTLTELSDLKEHVGNRNSQTGIYGEIHKLSTIPIGTILPWIPTKEQPNLPDGWVICDGTRNTPNLANMFLRGVTSRDKLGVGDGTNTIPKDGEHSHGKRTDKVHSNRITYRSGSDNNGVWFNHAHGIPSESGHDHGGNNLPPHYNVLYIMKVK